MWAVQKLRHIILPFQIWITHYLTHYLTFSDIVDLVKRILFEVCSKEDYQREAVLNFCVENPMEGKDGREDFMDEDMLDIELGA